MKAEFSPEVGDGVTILYLDDRIAATVVQRDPRYVVVQEDWVYLLNQQGSGEPDELTEEGHGVQRYRYDPNPDGRKTAFTLRKNGQWVRAKTLSLTGIKLIEGRNHHISYD